MKKWLCFRKAKKIFFMAYHRYQKCKRLLCLADRERVQRNLQCLQQVIIQKDFSFVKTSMNVVKGDFLLYLRKNLFQRVRDFVLGIVVALFVAILIRQMWFELYEVPTGSMRPTFKEQDRLAVSKTPFGVNYPLKLSHFYFDPDKVKRNGIVIFTVEDMDIRDGDTVYFYLFPGKKLFTKRLIGKPGDVLYFYGGKIYGISIDGKDITSQLQPPSLEKIAHVPFTSFEGTRISLEPTFLSERYNSIILRQMNQPIVRLYVDSLQQVKGELSFKIQKQYPKESYGSLWGMENFAMARLLTKEQVHLLTDQDIGVMEDGVLYLELKHHPNIANSKLETDVYNRVRPTIGVSTSIIPLQERHVQALMDNLYTARFVVNQGFVHRYEINGRKNGLQSSFPFFPGIPDGVYEFYYGTAYQIGWQGIATKLGREHPIYQFDSKRVQMFFNLGMEFDNRFNPEHKGVSFVPSRYGYFRDGDLYLMDGPIIKRDDPILTNYIKREKDRQESTRGKNSYLPFVDKGAPLDGNGNLDVAFIRKTGLVVPPNSYFVLGDNYANSGDSRDFGFVPQENLKGVPSLIFWPPGPRWGFPNQPFYSFLNPGRVVIWSVAIFCLIGGVLYRYKRMRLPLDFD
jgi:signal peptidase I